MAVKLYITPDTTSLTATAQTTVLTISTSIAGAPTDASLLTYSNGVGTLSGQSTVNSALDFLANQFFVQTSAPTANTTNLAEGDLYYDTDDNQLKIYRETSTGTYAFVTIMIGGEGNDSDTIDAGSF